jgi:hypothetical protein
MRRLYLLFTLLPALASAQTTTATALMIVPTATPSLSTYTYNSGCDTAISVQWQYNATLAIGVGNLCGSLTAWATTGECGDTANTGAGDILFDTVSVPGVTVQLTKSAPFTVTPSALPSFKTTTLADGGVTSASTCGASGITVTNKICASVQTSVTTCGFTTANYLHATPLVMTYDTEPPSAPVIGEASPEDSSASVTFSATTDAATVTAQYRVTGTTDFVGSTDAVTGTVGVIKVPGLTNGTSYDVQLTATDAAGNVSTPSAIATVIPVHTVGFFGTARANGSTEQGGCSATGSLLPLAGLALALALIRKSRR